MSSHPALLKHDIFLKIMCCFSSVQQPPDIDMRREDAYWGPPHPNKNQIKGEDDEDLVLDVTDRVKRMTSARLAVTCKAVSTSYRLPPVVASIRCFASSPLLYDNLTVYTKRLRVRLSWATTLSHGSSVPFIRALPNVTFSSTPGVRSARNGQRPLSAAGTTTRPKTPQRRSATERRATRGPGYWPGPCDCTVSTYVVAGPLL
ncbi:hypothetical protein BD310DRAFT_268683 [Dichomitus squalens]|uniref:Uncharacterized protein n=1 Tax=Dichomitus squalens TaxID=114155 RepID=A0A4Q9Q1E2_9APHY|nr:hypothetical protein BD310DRAFT_268683 [Dichomitus squalens]